MQPVLLLQAACRFFGVLFGQTPDTAGDSLTDSIGQLHDDVETCGLKKHMVKKAGHIDDSGNIQISYAWKLFVYAGAGLQGAPSQREISHMGRTPERSVNCNDDRLSVKGFDIFDRLFQVPGVNGIFQSAVYGTSGHIKLS